MDVVGRYVDAVRAEIAGHLPWRPLDAVFVGGGTPSAVPPVELGRILAALTERFGLAAGAEVTLEANPEDWTPGRAAELVDVGFTRVSFGAQSYDSSVLASLGRRHSPEQIDLAVELARQAGLESVSLDLIFGTPGETLDSWAATLDRAIATDADHVSAYSLTVEPGTALWKQVRAGADGPDPDDQADKWELADERLASTGLVRYEVSNHARPGHHCVYNLSVWGQGSYAGFGLGAHGFFRGRRTANVRRLDTYLDRMERGLGPVQSSDPVEGWGAELERLMLGLRRTCGVVAGEGGEALLASPEGERLRAAGVIDLVGDRLVVIRPLLTDEVIRTVLALSPPSASNQRSAIGPDNAGQAWREGSRLIADC
jgi:putative oxygen-independent coproporphyrinogen III oxidase